MTGNQSHATPACWWTRAMPPRESANPLRALSRHRATHAEKHATLVAPSVAVDCGCISAGKPVSGARPEEPKTFRHRQARPLDDLAHHWIAGASPALPHRARLSWFEFHQSLVDG